jgi:3-oxoacyl-[acyl-carrier-protein] synthase II
MEDAGLEDISAWAASAHAVLGTTHGAAGYSEDYYRQVVKEGLSAASPMLFAEGVPNVASAQLSLMLGIRGGAQTIVGTRLAGMDALAMAARRIRLGSWDRAIVGAAEENTALLSNAYRACGRRTESAATKPLSNRDEFAFGCGAVVLVVESRRAAKAREARIRASIERIESRRVDARHHNAHDQAAAALCCAASPFDGFFCATDSPWIDLLDAAVASKARTLNSPMSNISSLSSHIGETFSVGPLAGIAAVLLCGGMPKGLTPQTGANSHVKDYHTPISRFGVLASDAGHIAMGSLCLE